MANKTQTIQLELPESFLRAAQMRNIEPAKLIKQVIDRIASPYKEGDFATHDEYVKDMVSAGRADLKKGRVVSAAKADAHMLKLKRAQQTSSK